MSQNKLMKSVTLLMLISILSRMLGFVRDILIASAFGANYQTDAYNIAVAVPEIIFGIIGLAISTTFIPILSESFIKDGKDDMFTFGNNIVNILSIISLFLCLLGIIFAPSLVKVVAPKFTGETFELTVLLTRISLINIIFMSVNACYTSILQVLDDFIVPSLLGVAFNAPIILYIVCFNSSSILGLTIATTIGNLLRIILQIPFLKKHGYSFKLFFNLKDSRIKKILYLILPVIIGAGVNQLNLVIDRALASGFDQGSISALNYSSRITLFLNSAISTSLVTVMYPFLSKKGHEKDYETFKAYVCKSIVYIMLIMIPCTVILMVLSTPITTVVFKRGVFDELAVKLTSSTLLFYSIALPFYGVRDILNAALFSIQQTKVTTINGIIGMIINIVMSLILSAVIGLPGIALAASIASIVTCFMLLHSLLSRVGGFDIKSLFVKNAKILLSAVAVSILIFYTYYGALYKFVNNGFAIFICIGVSSALGIMFYILFIYLFKIQEFDELMHIIKNKLRKA